MNRTYGAQNNYDYILANKLSNILVEDFGVFLNNLFMQRSFQQWFYKQEPKPITPLDVVTSMSTDDVSNSCEEVVSFLEELKEEKVILVLKRTAVTCDMLLQWCHF